MSEKFGEKDFTSKGGMEIYGHLDDVQTWLR